MNIVITNESWVNTEVTTKIYDKTPRQPFHQVKTATDHRPCFARIHASNENRLVPNATFFLCKKILLMNMMNWMATIIKCILHKSCFPACPQNLLIAADKT
jgi:hypothetical protein